MIIAEPARAAEFLSILDIWFEVIASSPHSHVMVSPSASGAAFEARSERPASTVWSALILGSPGLCAVSRSGRLVHYIVPHAAKVHMAETQALAQRGWAGVPERMRCILSRTLPRQGREGRSRWLDSKRQAWASQARRLSLPLPAPGEHEAGKGAGPLVVAQDEPWWACAVCLK
jgi:hypothetical protein